MATQASTPSIPKLTVGESVGAAMGTAQDAHIGVVRGYKAARDPEIVAFRAEANEARIAAIKAKLLADLAP